MIIETPKGWCLMIKTLCLIKLDRIAAGRK